MVLVCATVLGSFGSVTVQAADADWETAAAFGLTTPLDPDNDVFVPVARVAYSGYITDTAYAANVAPVVSTSGLAAFKLNLMSEDLVDLASAPGGFADAAKAGYAIDGRWRAGAPTKADLAGMFRKGGTLALTNNYDANAKGPAAGKEEKKNAAGETTQEAVIPGVVVTFAKVNPRAAAPRLSVNYGVYSNVYGTSNGGWTLTIAKTASSLSASNITQIGYLEICLPADGKKVADTDTWYDFPDTGYVNVRDLGDDGKVVKTTFFIRSQARATDTAYIPASIARKAVASSLLRAPRLKPNYKTETLRARAGMVVMNADETVSVAITAANATYSFSADLVNDATGTTMFVYSAVDKAKPGKPKTATQTIVLAPRAIASDIDGDAFTINDKGALRLNRAYEVAPLAVTATTKWARLPRLTGSPLQYSIRIRATAKAAIDSDTGAMRWAEGGKAASARGVFTYVWGVVNEEKKTNGVKEATVVIPAP